MTRRQSQSILLGFLAFAIASATGGVLYQRNRSQGPIDFYGRTEAWLILHAPHVNHLRLVPDHDGASDESLVINGRLWRIAQRQQITAAPGMRNIRYALLDRGTYDRAQISDCMPEWTDAFEFVDRSRMVWVAFSFDCPGVTSDEAKTQALSVTAVAELRKFIDEQER